MTEILSEEEARYQAPEDLEEETRDVLMRFCLALADTKRILGYRVSEWTNSAPALEATVAAAAITQEEFGHARALFSMLRKFPGAPEELESSRDLKRDVTWYPRLLKSKCQTWHDTIVLFALLDHGLELVFRAARVSEFAPLQHRIPKVLQEERYHRVFAESWLANLASRGDASRQILQDSIDRFAPIVVEWFGPAGESDFEELRAAGIVDSSNTQLRDQWLTDMKSLLGQYGLNLSVDEPDWEDWNEVTRDATH